MASIVDLRFFRQPGSISNVLSCHICHVFESNKYLLPILYTFLKSFFTVKLRLTTFIKENDDERHVCKHCGEL